MHSLQQNLDKNGSAVATETDGIPRWVTVRPLEFDERPPDDYYLRKNEREGTTIGETGTRTIVELDGERKACLTVPIVI